MDASLGLSRRDLVARRVAGMGGSAQGGVRRGRQDGGPQPTYHQVALLKAQWVGTASHAGGGGRGRSGRGRGFARQHIVELGGVLRVLLTPTWEPAAATGRRTKGGKGAER